MGEIHENTSVKVHFLVKLRAFSLLTGIFKDFTYSLETPISNTTQWTLLHK